MFGLSASTVQRSLEGPPPFALERKLGQGAAGEVHLARDASGGFVVVKLLLGRLIDSKRDRERFRREVAALERLRHPHVVSLVAKGLWPTGQPYYAVEWSSGVPLDSLLARAPLARDRALAIVDQVLDALEAAHALGIVHRDLKPENVLIERPDSGREWVRLIDFGLVKNVGWSPDDVAVTGALPVGSPVYMSPEQCTGASIGPPVDIYAVGCLLMELLTGEPPFASEDVIGLIGQHAVREPPLLSTRTADAPRGLVDAVARCLSKDAARRPTATELRALLRPFLLADRGPRGTRKIDRADLRARLAAHKARRQTRKIERVVAEPPFPVGSTSDMESGSSLRLGVARVAAEASESNDTAEVLVLRRLDREAPLLRLDGPVVLGRAPTCAPVIERDADFVPSELHCRLSPRDGGARVESIDGSATWKNGQRVREADLEPGDELVLGSDGPRFAVELLRRPSEGRLVPLPDAGLALRAQFEHRGRAIVVLSGTRVRFGRQRGEGGRGKNDLVLRALPLEGERPEKLVRRSRAISRRHGTFVLTRGGVAVVDDDSSHGTLLDGATLIPRVPRALPESFLLDVASGVRLRGRVLGAPFVALQDEPRLGLDGGHPVGAVRLDHAWPRGARISYVLLAREATIGSGEDDAIRIESPKVARAHARVVVRNGRFFISALSDSAPVAVAGRPVPVGAFVPLTAGCLVNLGGTPVSFGPATDEDMIPRLKAR